MAGVSHKTNVPEQASNVLRVRRLAGGVQAETSDSGMAERQVVIHQQQNEERGEVDNGIGKGAHR